MRWLAIILLTCLALPVHAGVLIEPRGPSEQRADPMEAFRSVYIGLGEALFTLPDAEDIPECVPDRTARTRALMIGAEQANNPAFPALAGPPNDLALLSNALVSRGVGADAITLLNGRDATRAGLTETVEDLLAATGCGDSVFLHVSAYAMPAALIGLDQRGSGIGNARMLGDIQGTFTSPGAAGQALDDGPYVLLNRSDSGIVDLLSAADLSRLILRLRNRGADVTVSLDVPSAVSFDLIERQARHDRTRYPMFRLPGGADCLNAACRDPGLTGTDSLSPRAGQFSVFYSTEEYDPGAERELPEGAPDKKTYGLMSYQMAVAIASDGRTTLGALARRIEAQPETVDRWQTYRMISTSPDLDLIAEERPETPPGGEIIIDSPQITRAAVPLTRPEIEVAGRIAARGAPIRVTVNGVAAEFSEDGSFTGRLKLKAGVNKVEVVALTRADETISRVFELTYQGDIRAVIGEGRRYALVIGIQSYGDGSGISNLDTPIGDAEAVAKVLTERYGFETELTLPDGRVQPLMLRDASYRDIQVALGMLTRYAGEKDTVLIFYAGHGVYTQATGTAYWLTSDAVDGLSTTYFDAKIVTDALNLMRAGNVLVISDSCYSGMLARDSADKPPLPEGDRLLALQRLAERRSRVVISSGGNTPVLDGGGGGHSVFARALLDALESPAESVFSARELQARIYSDVIRKAPQEPDFREVRGAGHDGGDFVFLLKDDG
ncbi:hypothetical protein ATO6_05765 [Oceanicola sp. 22II-s10i]|uniref:caspase family protein n=1 Tax=Oceanicola sp. 22II-s10i TaxID=1317116 RepID=UPI000B51EA75|nr:caspase family protein [Oceanicola sp. 22II-s10i]OWU86330.1 hypothetical protein ATO6_05765 [Oceanicola sp. 22II-s10i]